MKRWIHTCAVAFGLACSASLPLHAQEQLLQATDSTQRTPPTYDPFGDEFSPDHLGQGSGGVITPSPHESNMQTQYTRVNSDYYGVQFMLDSPLQIALGASWMAYEKHESGMQLKVRTAGIRDQVYDPLREEYVPRYFATIEASFDRAFRDNYFRTFKIRGNVVTEPKGLSMAGIGVLVSRGNLTIAGDRPLDRKLDVEATWMQVAGGYIMPLSPNKGGVNISVCLGVDLVGLKYQSHFTDQGEFVGAKVGSIGWLIGVGWNANTLVNLSAYVGGEWGFSTGGLHTPTKKVVYADIGRNAIYLGVQATGRWFNIVGGIQKESEYLESQFRELTNKALRYYLGANIYFRR